MRTKVVLEIAWRDLSLQLRGRRGWVLPFISFILLVPLAAAPFPAPDFRPPAGSVRVSGDIPPALRDAPGVTVIERGGAVLRQDAEGLVVIGDAVARPVRRALDGPVPTLTVETVPTRPIPLPGRSLILALLAASLLTGAVSESVPGERGRGTLEALLTAAVTRGEIVMGKWLAWAGFGAVAALLAGGVAIATGRMPLGPWLLVLPTVPLGSVALGLYLVRRARDVVGGATVSLRVLPAVLSILGIVAWFTGLASPVLGACIPLGGALVAAGNTWGDWPTSLIAASVTLIGATSVLVATARDLERVEEASEDSGRMDLAGLPWVALGWWGAIASVVAWHVAGNPGVAAALDPGPAVLGACVAVGLVGAIELARAKDPFEAVASRAAPMWGWFAAVGAAFVVTAGRMLPSVRYWSDDPALLLWAHRMDAGLGLGVAPWLALLAVTLQELLFRGLAQRAVGPVIATLAYVAIVSPQRPLEGLVVGASLSYLVHRSGSVWPAVLARGLAVLPLWYLGSPLP